MRDKTNTEIYFRSFKFLESLLELYKNGKFGKIFDFSA